MQTKKHTIFAALIVLAAMAMSACGIRVDSTVDLADDLSGTRTFALTIAQSEVDEYLKDHTVQEAEEAILKHKPDFLDYGGMKTEDDRLRATFSMSFKNAEEYSEKIQDLLDLSGRGDNSQIQLRSSKDALINGFAFKENFTNDALFEWVAEALVEEGLVSESSQSSVIDSQGTSTVKFGGKTWGDKLFIDINEVKGDGVETLQLRFSLDPTEDLNPEAWLMSSGEFTAEQKKEIQKFLDDHGAEYEALTKDELSEVGATTGLRVPLPAKKVEEIPGALEDVLGLHGISLDVTNKKQLVPMEMTVKADFNCDGVCNGSSYSQSKIVMKMPKGIKKVASGDAKIYAENEDGIFMEVPAGNTESVFFGGPELSKLQFDLDLSANTAETKYFMPQKSLEAIGIDDAALKEIEESLKTDDSGSNISLSEETVKEGGEDIPTTILSFKVEGSDLDDLYTKLASHDTTSSQLHVTSAETKSSYFNEVFEATGYIHVPLVDPAADVYAPQLEVNVIHPAKPTLLMNDPNWTVEDKTATYSGEEYVSQVLYFSSEYKQKQTLRYLIALLLLIGVPLILALVAFFYRDQIQAKISQMRGQNQNNQMQGFVGDQPTASFGTQSSQKPGDAFGAAPLGTNTQIYSDDLTGSEVGSASSSINNYYGATMPPVSPVGGDGSAVPVPPVPPVGGDGSAVPMQPDGFDPNSQSGHMLNQSVDSGTTQSGEPPQSIERGSWAYDDESDIL